MPLCLHVALLVFCLWLMGYAGYWSITQKYKARKESATFDIVTFAAVAPITVGLLITFIFKLM